VDERFYRPAEVESLVGDATKARPYCNGDRPPFPELVREMVQADMESVSRSIRDDIGVELGDSSRNCKCGGEVTLSE
jgi:hypothetical protein